MKICLAGAGAFGAKHIEALAQIDGVEVVSLVGRKRDATQEVAQQVRHRACRRPSSPRRSRSPMWTR